MTNLKKSCACLTARLKRELKQAKFYIAKNNKLYFSITCIIYIY